MTEKSEDLNCQQKCLDFMARASTRMALRKAIKAVGVRFLAGTLCFDQGTQGAQGTQTVTGQTVLITQRMSFGQTTYTTKFLAMAKRKFKLYTINRVRD